MEMHSTATGAPACEPAKCGDGLLWAGVEECDDGDIINEMAAPTPALEEVAMESFRMATM